MRRSNYDKFPAISVGSAELCHAGWYAIAAQLSAARVICIECYPGVDVERVEAELVPRLGSRTVLDASSGYKAPDRIQQILHQFLGDDPVFGRMNGLTLEDWFDEAKAARIRSEIATVAQSHPILVIGSGASLLAPHPDLLIYADMARWEIQMRFRRGVLGNLGCDNRESSFAEKYKCGYFAEWRAADRLKKQLLPRADFILDTNDNEAPKLVPGDTFELLCKVPRSVRFEWFPTSIRAPGVGTGWRRSAICPGDAPNHAWCFDCVPEENSLLLGFR